MTNISFLTLFIYCHWSHHDSWFDLNCVVVNVANQQTIAQSKISKTQGILSIENDTPRGLWLLTDDKGVYHLWISYTLTYKCAQVPQIQWEKKYEQNNLLHK